MREQLSKIFPEEIQDLARMGVYTLLVSMDGKELIALSPETAYHFSRNGQFIKTTQASSFNFNQFEKIHLVSVEEYGSILKTAR